MIVVDMESSGLEPQLHSLVSVGAVDFNNPSNQFYMECRIWDGARVEDEALAINGFTREQITDSSKKSDKELIEAFLEWVNTCKTCKEHTIVGQNPSADRDFLKYTAHRYHINWQMAHRIIDLHSIAYFHMLKRGIPIPIKNTHSNLSLDKILLYVGVPEEPKPHNGLVGAKLEAEAFNRLINEKPLWDEFKHLPIPWLA
jgi:DNA polymerase III epsilon subunit-like protein